MSFRTNCKPPIIATLLLGLILILSGCLSGGGGGSNNDSGNPSTTTTAAPTTTTTTSIAPTTTTTTTVPPAITSIEGTAATGAAINGIVYLKDALNTVLSQTIGPGGKFIFDTSGLQAPLVLRVVPGGEGATEYSFSDVLDGNVNVTPLTTLATFIAAKQSDLDLLYNQWSGNSDLITRVGVDTAIKIINANLDAQIRENGLDPQSLDFIHDPFDVNGMGVDGVLDRVRVTIAFQTRIFQVADVLEGFALIAFNLNLDGVINIPDSSRWRIIVSGASATTGNQIHFGASRSDFPANKVPTDLASINLKELLEETTLSENFSFSNPTVNLDTASYDGILGSTIRLDLAVTLADTDSQGVQFMDDYDLRHSFTLLSPVEPIPRDDSPVNVSEDSVWKLVVTGTTSTDGILATFPRVIRDNVPGASVPANEDEFNFREIVDLTILPDANVSFTITSTDIDTSGFTGAIGSKIIADINGTMSTFDENSRPVSFSNAWYRAIYELL